MIYARLTFDEQEILTLKQSVEQTAVHVSQQIALLRGMRHEPAEMAFYESAEARVSKYRAFAAKMKPGREVGFTEDQLRWFRGSVKDAPLLDKLERPFRDDRSQDAEPEED